MEEKIAYTKKLSYHGLLTLAVIEGVYKKEVDGYSAEIRVKSVPSKESVVVSNSRFGHPIGEEQVIKFLTDFINQLTIVQ